MTRRAVLVGGPGDGTVIETGASSFYRVPDFEHGDAYGYPIVDYRRERVAFIVPAHLEATVRAGLADVELTRTELVDMASGERSVRLELEVWATAQRLDAIRVELSLVNAALAPLTFVEVYDDSLVAEELKRRARERLEALAELVTPGHTA